MDITAIHVTVVADELPLRQLITTTLERSGRFVVDAPDLDTWSPSVARHQPEVLLIDLTLGDDPLADLAEVQVTSPHTMVAVLTAMPADEQERRVVAAGAFVLYETSTISQLPEMITADLTSFRRALEGEHVVAPSARVRRTPPASTSLAVG